MIDGEEYDRRAKPENGPFYIKEREPNDEQFRYAVFNTHDEEINSFIAMRYAEPYLGHLNRKHELLNVPHKDGE